MRSPICSRPPRSSPSPNQRELLAWRHFLTKECCSVRCWPDVVAGVDREIGPFLRKLITDKAETPIVESATVDSGPLFCADALALPLFDRCLFAPLEQSGRFHPIRPGRERRRSTAPAQRLDLPKERRIGAQRCEILEEQREIALFAENVRREVFDLTV